MHGMHGS
jgi:hypothetical protein